MDWYQKASEAAKFISDRFNNDFTTCIQGGSGSSDLVNAFRIIDSISFSDIPFLEVPTFHKGAFLNAKDSNNNSVLIITGRLHYYEGYSAQEITFPIRILKQLDVKSLILTNAAGGLNPNFKSGEVILVKDHINLLPDHPLRGQNDERFGLRFPDLSNAYDQNLRQVIQDTWKNINHKSLNEGVYACLQGPSLETPAEYNMLHRIGADLVGMSTVPEVIVANHCNIKTAVLSIVTNVCYPPEEITPTTVEEVIAVANVATGRISGALVRIVEQLSQ